MFNARTITNIARPVCQRAAARSLSQVATSATRKGPSFDALNKVKTFHARNFFSTPLTERSAPVIADADVTKLFNLWNEAAATLDPDAVAKRYASKCVLLPTISDTPRTDYAGLKSYFTDFLKMKPQGVVLESNVIQGEDWCMDAGLYEFTMGATGNKVKARYTWVYVYEGGEWKVAHHHSSMMPEQFL